MILESKIMSLPNPLSLSKKFEAHLRTTRGVSSKTLRNYRADLAHFTNWSKLHLQSQGYGVSNLDDVFQYFSGQLVALYKGYHLENRIPEATTNRRLSTLRNFAKFLVSDGLIQENPMEAVSNLKQTQSWEENINGTIAKFESYLTQEGVSKITCKNYLSDVRQFLLWIPKVSG